MADARLEIAPAAAGTSGSGTQSGVSAGGEGEMLANEQLQQSKEDLVAREAAQLLRVGFDGMGGLCEQLLVGLGEAVDR